MGGMGARVDRSCSSASRSLAGTEKGESNRKQRFEPEKGEGGAIAIEQNGTLQLDEALITGNTAASAGGGVEDDGELVVENSTISHNTVTGGLGLGGGISSENPNVFSHELVTVVNSTIAGNSVSGGSTNEGGAIYDGSILKRHQLDSLGQQRSRKRRHACHQRRSHHDDRQQHHRLRQRRGLRGGHPNLTRRRS